MPHFFSLKQAFCLFLNKAGTTQSNIAKYSLDEAREKFLKQGRQKGQLEGRQESIEKGMQAAAINMLKKSADLSFISEVTGLSSQEIKKLKNSNSK